MSGRLKNAATQSHTPAGEIVADGPTELSSRRTGMSFQRTRMSADRTLMSVIRTSLSLIGFGFTVFQMFEKLHGSKAPNNGPAPHHFGKTLVWFGIGVLVLGIAYHLSYMLGLRKERNQSKSEGLIHAQSRFPVSMILIVALLLLIIGCMAILSMTFNVGPFY